MRKHGCLEEKLMSNYIQPFKYGIFLYPERSAQEEIETSIPKTVQYYITEEILINIKSLQVNQIINETKNS